MGKMGALLNFGSKVVGALESYFASRVEAYKIHLHKVSVKKNMYAKEGFGKALVLLDLTRKTVMEYGSRRQKKDYNRLERKIKDLKARFDKLD